MIVECMGTWDTTRRLFCFNAFIVCISYSVDDADKYMCCEVFDTVAICVVPGGPFFLSLLALAIFCNTTLHLVHHLSFIFYRLSANAKHSTLHHQTNYISTISNLISRPTYSTVPPFKVGIYVILCE